MKLESLWQTYQPDVGFNLYCLPEEVRRQGRTVYFHPHEVIVSKGDTLQSLYFIQSGQAIGQREYANGKELTYFRVQPEAGNLGLLELLSRKSTIVATIIAMTEVKAVCIDASVIYDLIMNDIHMMRRCLSLIASDFYRESGTSGRYYYVEGINRIRYYLLERYNQVKAEKDVGLQWLDVSTGRICIGSSYDEMANSTGLSIRTVGRCLQKLRESGEVYSVHQRILIGPDELEKIGDQLQMAQQ